MSMRPENVLGSARRATATALVIALSSVSSMAQTSASVTGRVVDVLDTPIPSAVVQVRHRLTGWTTSAVTGPDGAFQLLNLPAQPLQLEVEADGFQTHSASVDLRVEANVSLLVALPVAGFEDHVRVSAPAALADSSMTGSRTAVTADAIDLLPRAAGSRGLEAVLVSFPGFAQNANGAIHPRGAHNQMTYLIDGLPISDQLTGAFANALDPSLVQHVELLTGNIPAEFGNKVSGVAVVTTKSGLGLARAFEANAAWEFGSFSTHRMDLQVGGVRGRAAYFATASTLTTDRFLDAVSRLNDHNQGRAHRLFMRLDKSGGGGALTRLHVMGGRSSFELANLPSQQAAGQDQRQRLGDGAVWLAHGQALGRRSTVEVIGAYRTVSSDLEPSAGDRPVTAAQTRAHATAFVAARVSATTNAHSLRAGVDASRFPVRERFSFGVTDASFNSPDTAVFNPALLAFDLTRGGVPFEFRRHAAGRLLSAFVQDTWRVAGLTAALGIRYDAYAFLATGHQLQPRVGASWGLWDGNLVLRASYNRNYHLPPNENLLLSSSPEAASLAPVSVQQTFGPIPRQIAPERQDVFEVGAQAGLGSLATLDLAFYRKRSLDQQDNNNFLETGIVFPVTLAELRARGAEMRLTFAERRGASGALSATMARAVASPPFTGGLFLGQETIDALSSGPFLIDHDQRLSVHLVAQQRIGGKWRLGASVRHDSGLISNPSDPAEVAADPDYADLLDYVDLTAPAPRVRPRTIADLMLTVDGKRASRNWRLRLQVTNLTNRTALYNFQSVFVGTRLVQPRAVSARVQLLW